MLKRIFFYVCILCSFLVTAQKEANIWYFGEYAGLDFNSGSPVALTDGQLNTLEGCASIADKNGDLLFYSDGITVWNKNHSVMQNGNGLLGDPSSTHSALIVPMPENGDRYFIFTVDAYAEPNGLNYSEVDMKIDNGLGAITSIKNIQLETPTSEKISAIKHANNVDYWVISHRWESDEFIAYKITKNGVNLSPIVSKVGAYIGETLGRAPGAIKISPNGKKIAVANAYSWGDNRSNVEAFDFDTATGKLSNPITVDFNGDYYASINYRGIEFSPDSNLLYYSKSHYLTYPNVDYTIYQVNLSAGDEMAIQNSRELIYQNKERATIILQQAIDGKIYVTVNDNEYLDIINNPNVIGSACNYQLDGVYLNGRKCKAGLPPFIQSYFNIKDIVFENTCFGDATKFTLADTVDSAVWDFDDAASGVNNTSTDFESTHVFTSTGTYEVSVTVISGAETATKTATVTIHEAPNATQPLDVLTCDDNNDGFYTFDLTQQDIAILNGQNPTIFEVLYYTSMADYTNNNPIVNPTSYNNIVAYASETIVAAVKNRSNILCDAITSFSIQTFKTPTPNQTINKLSFCDNNSFGTHDDGRIQFDLTQKATEILNGQSISDFNIKYFTDAAFLNEILNPSSYVNTNRTEIIYVQVSNKANAFCVANTQFNIEVLELPITNAVVDLKQCDDDLDGFSVFNLNEVIAEITANASSEKITFHETLADANSGNAPILNTTAYTNEVVSTDIIWARVENSNQCYRTTQVNLIVSTTQIPLTFTRGFYECDDATDGDSTNGISEFDFSTVNSEIEAMFPIGQQLIINYYRNQADALAENNPVLNISNYRNDGYPNKQNIFIRVDSAVNNDCLGLGHHITLHVEKQPVANPVIIPEQCDDDGDSMYAFSTTNVETTILNGQTGMTVSYWDKLGNPLSSPLPNPFLTSSQIITARVTNATSQDLDGACFDEITISFNVDAAAVAYPIEDIMACDEDNDGLFEFDTSNIQSSILNGQTGMVVSYKDENGNALPSPLPNPFFSPSQEIAVRVENPLSAICFDETIIKLVVVEQPVLNMSDTWTICEGEYVEVVADEGYDEYVWSTNETSNVIKVFEPGTYQVTATNSYKTLRCETSKTINVLESNIAKIVDISTEDWTQNKNIIEVFVEGNGDYEYSLDGIVYQDHSIFTDLPIKDYKVYVRDKKGCGEVTEDVYLMYYPKFFTPNNDGTNDTWHIYNASLETNNIIYIYDRYGKLLKQLSPNSPGWDGLINGQKMPTSDYWFLVNRQNGKQYKGHFTLKR